jgi:hypothetical protein
MPFDIVAVCAPLYQKEDVESNHRNSEKKKTNYSGGTKESGKVHRCSFGWQIFMGFAVFCVKIDCFFLSYCFIAGGILKFFEELAWQLDSLFFQNLASATKTLESIKNCFRENL